MLKLKMNHNKYIRFILIFVFSSILKISYAQSFVPPVQEETCVAYGVCLTTDKLEAGQVLRLSDDKGQPMTEMRCQKPGACTLVSYRDGVRVKEDIVNYVPARKDTPRFMLERIRRDFADKSSEFYMNGRLRSVTELEFDSKGDSIKSTTSYSDDGILVRKNRWHKKYGAIGKQIRYHKNGAIKTVETYGNEGGLESKQEFDETGKQLLADTYYPDGSRK
jgi:hypothetical protein